MGVKNAAKEAFKAELMIVAQVYRDGNKRFKKIPKGVIKDGVLKYL